MKRDGTFSIQVLGDKDIVIHQTSDSDSYEKLIEDTTVSDFTCIDLSDSTEKLNDLKEPRLQTDNKADTGVKDVDEKISDAV